MNKPPLVSVIVPVYNRLSLVLEALESILVQTYKNFELLVIDDNSLDETKEGLVNIAKKDSRIKILFNNVNRGPAYSRNMGIKYAKGEFIALLDSDDISLPDRLTKQVNFMLANPSISICGGLALRFKENKEIDSNLWKKPITNKNIRLALMFGLPVITSTLLIRKKLFCNINFDLNFPSCQDYKLIVDVIMDHQIINLNEPLVYYRIHPNQITSNQSFQRSYSNEVSIIYWSKLGVQVWNQNSKQSLMTLLNLDGEFELENVSDIICIFDQIWKSNEKHKFLDRRDLSILLTKKFNLMLSMTKGNVSFQALPDGKWLTNRFKITLLKYYYGLNFHLKSLNS